MPLVTACHSNALPLANLRAAGMPPVTNQYDESLGKQAYELAKK